MGSRKTHEGVEKVYAAAQAWVDCALCKDDSLFTPGKPIWTQELLGELRQRFLDQPDESNDSFIVKLERQLADSPPEVYQLMGEVLYFHFLIVWTKSGAGELERIRRVLGWSPDPVSVPADYIDALTPGIAAPGAWFHTSRPFQVGFLVEFAEQWKELEADQQRQQLDYPWKFKSFTTQVELRGKLFTEINIGDFPQREALLHLVHPDTFEGIVSVAHKRRIAGAMAFGHFINKFTADVDRNLFQVRKGLEAHLGKDFDFYYQNILKCWNEGAPLPPPFNRRGENMIAVDDGDGAREKPDIEALAEEVYLPVSFLGEIETLLEEKKQVIFQGPPGTGKTFVAQKLAACLAGSEERVRLVQFHPSYAYEDFVQGYRPTQLENGQPRFELKNGPLREMADRAKDDSNADYFLIIDEINRGNLAKILGELYFLLEYRDQPAQLQYSDEEFRLPKNLYIIGTMNTADRSIALVDLALRRRFYFVEFHPDNDPIDGVLRRWLETNAPDMASIANVVDKANKELDDRHAAIGPSYFMKDDLDEDKARLIWKHSVLPYVEERLFGEENVRDRFDFDKLWRGTDKYEAEENVDDADREGQGAGG